MKDQNIAKVNNIGKIGCIITLIAKILIGIGIAGIIIGIIITAALPEDLITGSVKGQAEFEINIPESMKDNLTFTTSESFLDGSSSVFIEDNEIELTDIQVDGNKITASGEGEFLSFSFRNITFGLIFVLLVVVTTFVMLFFIGSVCKSFRECDSPFEENVITSLNRFEIMFIVWAVISMLFDSIGGAIFTGMTDFSLNINFTTIMMILVVYGLIAVFKYGAKLQQESDETL